MPSQRNSSLSRSKQAGSILDLTWGLTVPLYIQTLFPFSSPLSWQKPRLFRSFRSQLSSSLLQNRRNININSHQRLGRCIAPTDACTGIECVAAVSHRTFLFFFFLSRKLHARSRPVRPGGSKSPFIGFLLFSSFTEFF